MFQDVDLRRLSSHCEKKSRVNMLQDEGSPINIASALTCTTGSVLQNSYVSKAKAAAQREALRGAMQPMIEGVANVLDPIFCTKCGLKCDSAWAFCPKCGSSLCTGQCVRMYSGSWRLLGTRVSVRLLGARRQAGSVRPGHWLRC